MEVNDLLIENLAKLSHLSFSDSERNEIKADLQQMISFVEKLKELDTAGVECAGKTHSKMHLPLTAFILKCRK
jgi:aspartyl/glutamyl-tRNA(Asn/Gln) amidotransferase C subunit